MGATPDSLLSVGPALWRDGAGLLETLPTVSRKQDGAEGVKEGDWQPGSTSFPTAEKVSSLGKNWHRFCLKCEHCHSVLSPGGHAEVRPS